MKNTTRVALAILFALTSAPAFAQSGALLTEEAFITPGRMTLDVFGQTIGDEPNFLSFTQTGRLLYRTRVDGPVVRLSWAPSENAQFEIESNLQTYALDDPRYRKSISDFGDTTLRGKLGLAKGEAGVSPAVALQFQVTLPHTSYGNGLAANTVALETELVVSYRVGKLSLHGNAGIAIQDEPERTHEQRDFASLSGAIRYAVNDSFDVFGDAGGYFGEGIPGVISKREARLGFAYKRQVAGRETSAYLAGRRGLVDFQGKWGLVAGVTVAIKAGQ